MNSTTRPGLPSLRKLTAELREAQGEVSLCLVRGYSPSRLGHMYAWRLLPARPDAEVQLWIVEVCGRDGRLDGRPFDAVAAARRLLAAARDAGYR